MASGKDLFWNHPVLLSALVWFLA